MPYGKDLEQSLNGQDDDSHYDPGRVEVFAKYIDDLKERQQLLDEGSMGILRRILRAEIGDLNEKYPEPARIESFSKDARASLTKVGYSILRLAPQLPIIDMRRYGFPLTNGCIIGPGEYFKPVAGEVAVRMEDPFLKRSGGEHIIRQLKRISSGNHADFLDFWDHSELLGVPGIGFKIGSPADYSALAFTVRDNYGINLLDNNQDVKATHAVIRSGTVNCYGVEEAEFTYYTVGPWYSWGLNMHQQRVSAKHSSYGVIPLIVPIKEKVQSEKVD